MPLGAPECFDGHARPAGIDQWTAWVCPEDGELVFPGDLSRDDILDANLRHPLVRRTDVPKWPDELDLPDLSKHVVTFDPRDPWRRTGARSHPSGYAGMVAVEPRDIPLPPAVSQPHERTGPSVAAFVPPERPEASSEPPPSPRSRAGDPNDSLVTISAPVLAGFALASVVIIDTSTSLSGRPEALPAVASFAVSAVLLVFSIQMLALGALPGLASSRKLRLAKAWLYEFGVLAFLTGLGLFLWPRTWSAASIAGLAAVGLAIVSDLILVGVAWCERDRWARPAGAA